MRAVGGLPLAAARDKLEQPGPNKLRWKRAPLDPAALRPLMERSDAEGFKLALFHIGLWLCTLICFLLAATTFAAPTPTGKQRITTALLLYLAFLLHGTVGSTMGFACHELGHGTVTF